MVLFQDNLSPYLTAIEGTTPANPASGNQKLFVRSSDHVLCLVNSGGTVTPQGSGLFSGCSVYNSTDEALSAAGEGIITFDTEYFDTANYHSVSSNTGRMTCPSGGDGYFLYTVNIRMDADQTGYVVIRKNNATIYGLNTPGLWDSGDGLKSVSFSNIVQLAATDYLECKSTWTGAVNMKTGNGAQFSIVRLGS